MEVQDYVSVVGRRWWLLLCPFVAMAAVVLVTISRPPSFTSTATVSALAVSGGPTGQYSGTSGAKTFVANFQAALRSPSVINDVVRAHGVKAAAARNGLSSAPVGESTIIEVTYRTPFRAQAEPVATEAAKRTMLFLFESQVGLAEIPLAKAEEELVAADQKLAEFTRVASTPVPDRDYQILADQISSLQTLQAESAARQEISIAARYSSEIVAKQGELTKLAVTLAEYNALTANRSDAVNAVTATRQNLDQAKAQFAAGDPNRIITSGDPVQVSSLGPAAKGGVTAFVSGLFFAAGIALLLELRRSQKLASAKAGEDLVDPPRADPTPLPKLTKPVPAEPSFTEPKATEPVPAKPSPAEPSPAEPSPTEPDPTELSLAEPSPAEPAPAEPIFAEPTATEPAPAEPIFAPSRATEPTATEPVPADPKPPPPIPVEPEAAGEQPLDQHVWFAAQTQVQLIPSRRTPPNTDRGLGLWEAERHRRSDA